MGSSSSSRRGFIASASAISTTRWSPWASSPTTRSALPDRSTVSISSSTRRASRARAARGSQGRPLTPAAVSTPMRTFSKTLSSGKTSVIWNVRTIPRRTRYTTERSRMLSPSNQISPALGGKKPVIRLKNVVLPAPLGPITARSSPSLMANETSRTACSLPKFRLTPSRRSSGAFMSRAPAAPACRGCPWGTAARSARTAARSGSSSCR